jgi:hypothetical protein
MTKPCSIYTPFLTRTERNALARHTAQSPDVTPEIDLLRVLITRELTEPCPDADLITHLCLAIAKLQTTRRAAPNPLHNMVLAALEELDTAP